MLPSWKIGFKVGSVGRLAVIFFLVPLAGFFPGLLMAEQPERIGLGELNRLVSIHLPHKTPDDFKSLDHFERKITLENSGSPVLFSIPGFETYGCSGCHVGDRLVESASERMAHAMTRLRGALPWIQDIPLRQYIIQPWADELLHPRQFAHATFDTIRIFPYAILIDEKVYGRATHLHETLHLTQGFLGPANELEAYGLNIRSDPKFLLLNFPYFSEMVTTFFYPELPEVLKNFFARQVKEEMKVSREAQWFMQPLEEEELSKLTEAIEKMEPLLKEVSRLNREHPLEASYLSEQTHIPSFLLDIAAVKLLPLPELTVSEDLRRRAWEILDTQMRKTDNTRLGYRINRRDEALLTLRYKLKMNDARQRSALYFHYLKEKFLGSDGELVLTLDDRSQFLVFLENKLDQIIKLIRFERLTAIEREAGDQLVQRIKKQFGVEFAKARGEKPVR